MFRLPEPGKSPGERFVDLLWNVANALAIGAALYAASRLPDVFMAIQTFVSWVLTFIIGLLFLQCLSWQRGKTREFEFRRVT